MINSVVIIFFAIAVATLVDPASFVAACDRTAELQPIEDCPVREVQFDAQFPVELHLQPFLLRVRGCTLWTRAYGLGSEPASIPAPTLHLQSGSTFRVNLYNDLEQGMQMNIPEGTVKNDFHEPNTTNLHTHGLHVSGQAPADDVSVVIRPQDHFSYAVDVPADHASGLHWYHPHYHGSTTLQVGGGAAGLLVVDEDPYNTPQGFLRRLPEIKLMVQFLDIVGLTRFSELSKDNLFRIVEGCEQGLFLTNGLVNPLVTLVPGQWTRLRMSHVSIGSDLNLTIPHCDMRLLAKDGVFLHKTRTVSSLIFLPPSRVDVAVRCYQDTTIYDNLSKTEIATIRVAGSPVSEDIDPNAWSWRRPFYLQDLRNEKNIEGRAHVEINLLGRTINGFQFRGFDHEYSLHNAEINSVEAWEIHSLPHPLHIHINHMQIQSDSSEWHQSGDWIDTVKGIASVRMRMDSFVGKVIMHCHISSHAEAGMLGIFYVDEAIDPDEDPNPSLPPPTLGDLPQDRQSGEGTPVPQRGGILQPAVP